MYAEDSLVVTGSNTFGEHLGKQLVSVFQKKNPSIHVVLETPGSGAGMDALIDGRAGIATTSRAASEDELQRARAAGVMLRAHSIGSYGIALVVNSKNPVRSLSTTQIRNIFTGAIRNWKEVGGVDAAIKLYIRDGATGSALGFRELAMRTQPYAKTAIALPSYESIMEEVSRDPAGIGYCGIGVLPNGIHPLQVDGVPANHVAINEGLYPYARTLYFYTDRQRETQEVKSFIGFVQSREGQEIFVKTGFAPRISLPLEREGIAP
jgi:phosphate transport system substrate-binding protein